MPSKKKKYNARFPPARIKKIMQTDDEVGKVAAAVPVIISRALELFVESLITKANEITQARNAKTLTTLHLKQCILAENKFDFLKDLVASVPDVQVEDDTSNSSLNPVLLSGSISDDAAKIPSTKPRLQRRKKNKNNKISAENNAGPSNSDDDDEEESDEEDEDEEESNDEENNNEDDESVNDKARHIIRGPELIQSNLEFKINRPTMMTSINSDDEDYDS